MKFLFEIVPFQGANSLICGVLDSSFNGANLRLGRAKEAAALLEAFDLQDLMVGTSCDVLRFNMCDTKRKR